MRTTSDPAVRALCLASLLWAWTAPAAAQEGLTDDERQGAVDYLEESVARFTDELAGLSDRQVTFRPDPESWSLAEIAEHLAIVEGVVHGILTDKVVTSPRRPEWRTASGPLMKDQVVRMAVTNRAARRFQAPPVVSPEGAYSTAAEAVAALRQARRKTLEFARTTDADLRSHFAENPALGMLDGYQWLLFAAAHTERHTAQAVEVKGDPAFPAN